MFIPFVDSPFVGVNVFNASATSTLLSASSNGNSFGKKIDLLKLLLRSIPAATTLAAVALILCNEIISVSVATIELILLALVFAIGVVVLRLDLKILFV